MPEEKSNLRVWIIVAILGLLVSCVAGAMAGGLVGYLTGKRSADRAYQYAPRSHMPRLEPYQPAPQPRVPTPEEPKQLPELPRLGRGGALVTDVTEGSPAERAGLQPGDIIVEVDGEGVPADGNLADLIAHHRPGDKVEVSVLRGGRMRAFEVELGRNPDKRSVPWLGLYYRPVPFVQPEEQYGGD
jgi:membrane-associated protease RseP (regulator of RpoE activity)